MAIGGVLFDIDGVLVTSWQPIDGAAQTLQVLADNPPPELGIFALYAPNRYLAAKTRLFIDFLSSRFGEAPAWDTFGHTARR